MIKITKRSDLELVDDAKLRSYISALLTHILTEYEDYCSGDDIEAFGAIFVLDRDLEPEDHRELCLSAPLTAKRFEYVDLIRTDYYNGLIILDNERCINIIGKREYFKNIITKEDI